MNSVGAARGIPGGYPWSHSTPVNLLRQLRRPQDEPVATTRNWTIVGCPSWAPPSKGSVPTWLPPSPRQIGHRRGRPQQSPCCSAQSPLFGVLPGVGIQGGEPSSAFRLCRTVLTSEGVSGLRQSYPNSRVPVGRLGRPIRSGGWFHPCLGPRPPYFLCIYFFGAGGQRGSPPSLKATTALKDGGARHY